MNTIKEVVENELGIITMENYVKYKKQIYESGISLEEVEKLSPDNVDSGDFWKYCDETPEWRLDTVANGLTKDESVDKANANNFNVACQSGVFSTILQYRKCCFNVLDIGAGFGMLRDALQDFAPNLKYTGVDVHPKFEECIKVKDCILPPEIMEKQWGYVFAINVFQHLSVRQRRTYYEQIAKICKNGYFILTNLLDLGRGGGFKCKDNNKCYVCHYGQFTEVQTYDETIKDLTEHFNIVSVQQRVSDSHFCFHLTPKEKL